MQCGLAPGVLTVDFRFGQLPSNVSYLAVGDGPPLVVLPGLCRGDYGGDEKDRPKNAARFRPLATLTGRTVYLVNRPKGLARETTMAELAARQAEAVAALSPEPLDVLGTSTGGVVALQLTLDHPQRVRKLVVACAASWLGTRGTREAPGPRRGDRAGPDRRSRSWPRCWPGRSSAGR